jgi:O-antigen/teichoic acid export membrane protein
MVALCITPAYGGIIALAPNIVHTLFGEKWQFVVFPLQILCLIMPLRCYYSLFLPVLVGINRPDVAFKNVAVASILMPIAYLMGVQWGIIGLCISWIIGFTVVFIIVLKQSLECVGLTFRSYLSSIRSQLICSISMTLIVLLFRTQLINMLNTITIIVLGSMLGIIVYLGLIYIFDKQLLNDFRILFRSRA